MTLTEMAKKGKLVKSEKYFDEYEFDATIKLGRLHDYKIKWKNWQQKNVHVLIRTKKFQNELPGTICHIGVMGVADTADFHGNDFQKEFRYFQADGGCGGNDYILKIKGMGDI